MANDVVVMLLGIAMTIAHQRSLRRRWKPKCISAPALTQQLHCALAAACCLQCHREEGEISHSYQSQSQHDCRLHLPVLLYETQQARLFVRRRRRLRKI